MNNIIVHYKVTEVHLHNDHIHAKELFKTVVRNYTVFDFFPVIFFICGSIFMKYTLPILCSSPLVVDDLLAHNTIQMTDIKRLSIFYRALANFSTEEYVTSSVLGQGVF
jgi:hypothetical protein